MSSRRLDLTPAARADLAGMYRYSIDEWGVEQAMAYGARLNAACDNLARFPDLGRRRREYGPGVRSLPVASHIAYYRALDDGVKILRITHALSRVESLD